MFNKTSKEVVSYGIFDLYLGKILERSYNLAKHAGKEGMKMTLVEMIAIKLGLAPAPIFDALIPALKSKAIFVANKLRVFDRLSNRFLSPRELAQETNADEGNLAMLLEVLVAVGYLKRKNCKYANTKVAQQWLFEGSDKSVGNILRHIDDNWAIWVGLEETIRTGKPVFNFMQICNERPEVQRNYTLGMMDNARMLADEVVSKVKVSPQARSLLDLGGAHGYYSIAFCRKYPQLNSIVLDLEGAIQIGKEVVNQEKMGDRVAFQVGDCVIDDIGSGYDVTLLFNLLHGESPDTDKAIVKKVYDALNRGGTIAIVEILNYKGKKESATGLLFALNLLAGAPRGRTYSDEEIRGWLEHVGFANIERIELRRMPGHSLMIATKPT